MAVSLSDIARHMSSRISTTLYSQSVEPPATYSWKASCNNFQWYGDIWWVAWQGFPQGIIFLQWRVTQSPIWAKQHRFLSLLVFGVVALEFCGNIRHGINSTCWWFRNPANRWRLEEKNLNLLTGFIHPCPGLVVSTHLKNSSQIASFPQVWVQIEIFETTTEFHTSFRSVVNAGVWKINSFFTPCQQFPPSNHRKSPLQWGYIGSTERPQAPRNRVPPRFWRVASWHS